MRRLSVRTEPSPSVSVPVPAYFSSLSTMKKTSLIRLEPGVNVIKHFSFVTVNEAK
jgi:hypothetical protein